MRFNVTMGILTSAVALATTTWGGTADGLATLLPTPRKAEAKAGKCRLARMADIRYVTDAALPKEGYRLVVGKDVTIASADVGGRVHALQTLKQLAGDATLDALTVACPTEIPCCRIEDAPKFPWRGYMLDTSRHFFGTAFIKKTLDAMAYHKLNVFHWHLVDGAGWRFPVDAYPALTNACATRTAGKRTTCWGRDIVVGQYGPFAHPREDIREILAYAKARGIEVVPEIDLPGHQGINGTFKFACCQSGLKPEGTNKWHGATGDLCVANPAVYPFYEKVLDELCEVFPSKVIHIGGDEVGGQDWARCPRCLALMREKGLKDQRELQNVIMRHFAEYLGKKGRRAIGWDEILIGGAMPQGTMMSHFHTGGKAHFDAVKRGHDVVMMPGGYTYFDCDQGLVADPHDIYQIFNGRLDWRRAYAFDPLAGVAAEDKGHILGLQGCTWTEIVCDESDVEWGMHPRLACLAEVGWAYPAKRDADAFLPKLSAQRERLVAMGFDAAPVGPLRPVTPAPEPKPAYVKTQGFTVLFKAALAEQDVTWTVDPSVPAGGYDLLIRAGKPYYKEGSVEIRHSDAAGKALGWKVLKQLEQTKSCNSLYLPKGELRSFAK